MGSVRPYSTAKGKRYEARYKKPDGTHGSKRGFTRKRDAEIWLAEVETTRARGAFIDPQASKVTIAEIGPTWIEAKRASMKPSSFAPVEAAWRLRVRPAWGGWAIADIRHTDIRAWVSTLSTELGASVTIRTFGVLASILDDAVYDARIALNPARIGRIGLPRKTRGRHEYLTHDQVFHLAKNAGDKQLLVLVLAYTGIRWGEAIALRVRDIDVAKQRLLVTSNAVEVQGEIHVGTPKSHKGRLVPVPAFVIEQLVDAAAGRTQDALLFPAPDGGYMRRVRSSAGSKSWFKNALAQSGLPIMTTHDLRHTAASLAVQSGANVKTIQRMLGHTSAAMTLDVYSDLFDTDLDEVSAALNKAASAARARSLNETADSIHLPPSPAGNTKSL